MRLPLPTRILRPTWRRCCARGLKCHGRPSKSQHEPTLLLAAFVLGAGYLGFQGIEWAGLIRDGLDLSSAYGAFFFLIVGAHSLHTAGALVWLARVWTRLRRGVLTPGRFTAAQVFWYFAVLTWPVIYFQVYR